MVSPVINHVFCCDVSGSMDYSLPKMARQLKNKIPMLVKNGDTITIIIFSGRNQCITLVEKLELTSALNLGELNNAIDRYFKPIGCTSFHDPLVATNKIIDLVKDSNKLWSFIFLSDGYNNDSTWSDVIVEMTKLETKVSSATIIEYGYYADSNRLSEMAETLGGSKIFSDDFEAYELQFDKLFGATVSSRIELDIKDLKKDLKYQQFVSIDNYSEAINVYGAEGKTSILIPENIRELYCLSINPLETGYVTDDDNMLSATYAMIVVNAERLRYEVAELILNFTKDAYLNDLYQGSYGKQKLSNFIEVTKSYVFDSKLRYSKGLIDDKVTSKQKFSILDLLDELSNPGNLVYPFHPTFDYSRTGAKAVTKKVLSNDDKLKLAKTTTAAQAKKVLSDAEAGLVSMVIKDEDKGYPISNLVWNENRANVSILLNIDVELLLPKNEVGLTKVDSTIFRNYTIICDGILNLSKLPVSLSEATIKILKKHDIFITAEIDDSTDQPIYILDLSKLPLINKSNISKVKSKELAGLEVDLLYDRFANKYIGYLSKLSNISDKEYDSNNESRPTYTYDQIEYLKSIGCTDRGYAPKVELLKTEDFYMALNLKTSIDKFSSIPKIEDVMAKLKSGKAMTPSESFMSTVMKDIDQYIYINHVLNINELLDLKVSFKEGSTKLLKAIAINKFGLILSRKWFTDKKGFDDNTVQIMIPGESSTRDLKFNFVETKQLL
jgi:hypothetical protein